MDIRHWNILGASLLCWSILAAPAAAEVMRINHTLKSEPHQTFATLMQQAESLATNLVDQGFAEDNVTEVSVHILGERNGQQVPLLSSRISRADWQKQLGIQQWTRYFRTSAVLLGFYKPAEPNQSPLSAFPSPNIEQSVSKPTSVDSSVPQPSPSGTNSIQQPISNPTSTGTTEQTTPTPDSPNNSLLRGASPEESDPGYR
ncbi:hypothetical protein [Gloeocapsopsis sp. IPPAS B-1203]|uniref:hypothetical protein n=1 Tax=Gloeocapsopsis sp. IPPAS B-1203 TaxID=2049454 RepID=UPI000C176B3F|nr:hypothetical protein [Gloeocapsopsis sp. IPPAS B-1203]PIG94087.1 hypothetical protein CSQ79_07035 [Gloeocapsopsis sp. IPPAS B-1203]